MGASKPGRRLTVDVSPLFETHWTGIPVFTRRAVQALMAQKDIALDFAFDLVGIPKIVVMDAIRANSGWPLRESYERNGGEHSKLVDLGQPIFYPTVKRHPGAAFRESHMVHDLSTLFMPETHETTNIDYHLQTLREEILTSDTVFCASGATRAALVDAYPSVRAKTRVLYQYADWPAAFEAMDRNLPIPKLGRYAVVIGTLEPRKNLSLLLESLSEPAIRNSDLRFVVVGRKGWKVDAFMVKLTPKERDRVIFSGFVSEFVKYRLLKHCEFLVFPSLYEGFGIPALEAMLLGKPVLASMTSSFPEVIGNAGVYFDPCSTTDFATAFQDIADPRKQAELGAHARGHAAQFSAQAMGRTLAEWALVG
jgi:glycosyltransferase involved in cell wall biosynthesis